ncbi:MAG: hypothetical protein ABIE74_06715 [Pseudomonadota bacterium]
MREKALKYHKAPRPGKMETLPFKSCSNQLDLSLAYTSGVAEPCIDAGVINAVEITGKSMGKIKVVINGAGAAGVATAKMLVSIGIK